jgi:hypothetical protein
MNIEFYPSSRDVQLLVPPPRPAATYIPEWYKKEEKFSEKNINIELLDTTGPGVKSCVPFLDAMMTGYIQETWQDIIVGFSSKGSLEIRFSFDPPILESRPSPSIPVGMEFYNTEFTWKLPWIPRLPKGWSAIYLPPLNQPTLPFSCPSGIIDSDEFFHIRHGNYPFYIKKGFEGVIPVGTPMFQIIPFKRESWKSKNNKWNEDEQKKREFILKKHSFGAYKKIFHIKKSFS